MKNFAGYHFSGQKDGEQILLVTRRHWFNILGSLFSIFLMVLALIGGYAVLPWLFPALNQPAFQGLFLFLGNFFAMIIWILFFLVWIDYYFDVWIITNKRIVDVQQKALFSREVSELELEKIQDITTEVLGVIPTFLNYGDVKIQTAGEQARFAFEEVPDPYAIKDLIMNLQKQQVRRGKQEFGAMIREEIHKNDV
ncbi:MAG: PH domain-containing protein [Parcubacteria group bacterium]|jgi:hypothetical protein